MVRLLARVLFVAFLSAAVISTGCDTGASKGSTAPKGSVDAPKDQPASGTAPPPPPAPK